VEAQTLAILCVVALLTAVLSAVVGMAGGITLLSVMLLFMEPLTAIPVHGVVQLVSNGSRSIIQREHIDRGILWRYSVLLCRWASSAWGSQWPCPRPQPAR
jgi:uncharacterized membrane protein YfcA